MYVDEMLSEYNWLFNKKTEVLEIIIEMLLCVLEGINYRSMCM